MTTDQCQASSTSVLRKLIFCCLLKQQTSDMDTKNEEASTGSRDLKRSCGERNYRSVGKKTPTSSLPDGSRVYGRDQDKEAVLGWLLNGETAINGSEVKIVVTTRNNGVPPIMAAISTCHLELLSDDDCLSMLADHVKAKSKFVTDPKLQAIMGKIARKYQFPPAGDHARMILQFRGSNRMVSDWSNEFCWTKNMHLQKKILQSIVMRLAQLASGFWCSFVHSASCILPAATKPGN
ncbi:hypothetical protein DKX38_013971 [Salix brachista]|uniref:NB-ARC domain-containing protein n=1 Tax=Salix brachista TaxID=2182728 RepID=A0A5N5LE65_9ROSI|nr:hypothetical protein DKX38_013971 [Salix brachista]